METPAFIRFSSALAGLVTLVFSVVSSAAPGDLYVPQSPEDTILRFSSDGTKTTFVAGLDQPSWIAFDRAGNLFVAQQAQGNIVKFTPSGEMTVFASGLSAPGALAFDGAGNFYVTELISDAGDITKITPDGT